MEEKIENRLEKLEMEFAYLQDEVNQLNELVTGQQLLLSKIEKQNEFIAKRLEDIDVEARPNRRPPHY
ncbi:MAG: SlyX family protein [Sphaerochaetaceae bacterium]|nr:SlyX family protein [Sphaerochaetaceae bacterium]